MTLVQAVFTYLVIWSITLFILLPVGVQPRGSGDPTHYQAAPLRLKLGQKLLLNTVLAAVVTFLLHLLLLSGWIPVREVLQ